MIELRASRFGAAAILLLFPALFGCSDNPVDSGSPSSGRAIYGIDDANHLVRFGSATPGTVLRRVPVSGLQVGEKIIGIDFRPADSLLYALGNTSRIYRVDTLTGGATPLGVAFIPAIDGTLFGIDFNPVADLIRLHSNRDQNLRIQPLTGALASDDPRLGYMLGDLNEGEDPVVTGTSYTNNFRGAATTVLYAIDSRVDALVTIAVPNDGVLTTVGPLGVAVAEEVGFDIDGRDGSAWAALRPEFTSVSSLYRVDLATGAVTEIGPIGNTVPVHGIAIVP